MSGPGVVMTSAWIGALLGPVVCALLIRRLLRGRRIFLAGALGGVVGTAWGLGVWAFLIEPATLTIRHVTLKTPRA